MPVTDHAARSPLWRCRARRRRRDARACRCRVLPGQAGPPLHHGQPGRRLRHLYAHGERIPGEADRRQAHPDQRAGGRRHDRHEPHGQRDARRPDAAADRRRGAGDRAALRSLRRATTTCASRSSWRGCRARTRSRWSARSRPTRASPTCRSSTGRRCGRAPARPTTIPISPPSCVTRSASSARSSSATRAPAT